MLKLTRIISFTILLLASIFAISCSKTQPSDKVPKKNIDISKSISDDFIKRNEELCKKNIEAMLEKMRIEREKKRQKLLEEEKQLVEKFCKTYLLTPEQTKFFSGKIQSARNRGDTIEGCDELLRIFKILQGNLESEDLAVRQNNLGTTGRAIKGLIPDFTLTDLDTAKKMLTDLISIIENTKEQLKLK